MNYKDYILEIFPKIINYRLARRGLARAARPITLTFSVTGKCQSNCKTCYIGREYRKNSEQMNSMEIKLDEIEKFFKNLEYTYFLNISGGEPFLRNDLVEVVKLALKYLHPRIIHIPTNAFMPKKIARTTRKILKKIHEHNPRVQFTVKPSIDGIGEKHDEIRGLPNNFKRLKETIRLLKKAEQDYSNFHLELGTVVSIFNINELGEIEDWVHRQGVQSYRNEIAEQREEFFNIGEDITPSDEVYENLMEGFKEKIKSNIKSKKSLAKITESMRFVYYDLVVKILRHKKQVIPCYAGISNIHLNYDGSLWPCCILGYAHSIGNIRDYDYDFDKLMDSQKAKQVLNHIKEKNCFCPLANQSYSNILMSWSYLFRVIKKYIRFYL